MTEWGFEIGGYVYMRAQARRSGDEYHLSVGIYSRMLFGSDQDLAVEQRVARAFLVDSMDDMLALDDGSASAMYVSGHSHPLMWVKRMHSHICDACSDAIEGQSAYRCAQCDYDLCTACFSRQTTQYTVG